MNKKIILIRGKKRSGKDYIGDKFYHFLQNKQYNTQKFAFADPIKEILCTSFGITLEELDYMKNSNTKIKLLDKTTNIREILQRFGTDAMQNQFNKCVWTDLAIQKINNEDYEYNIISDFRFPHEYINNSLVIEIQNNIKTLTDNHISENALNNFKSDYIIDNTYYCSDEVLNSHFNKILQKINNSE